MNAIYIKKIKLIYTNESSTTSRFLATCGRRRLFSLLLRHGCLSCLSRQLFLVFRVVIRVILSVHLDQNGAFPFLQVRYIGDLGKVDLFAGHLCICFWIGIQRLVKIQSRIKVDVLPLATSIFLSTISTKQTVNNSMQAYVEPVIRPPSLKKPVLNSGDL